MRELAAMPLVTITTWEGLADRANQPRPLLAEQRFDSNDAASAYEAVAWADRGKVVLEL